MASHPPLIVIVGETSSGKSALAMELARKSRGEIISADSWQVYKGFDIGTAKSTAEEQKQIKHHLIDIVDANEGFNAALYKKLANQAIIDITRRGKVPILVGGTALYVDSVLFDFEFLPTASPEVRAALNAKGLAELIKEAEAEGIDLSNIDKRNKRRVIRAIEAGGQVPKASNMRPNTLVLGLRLPRDELRQRLTERVEAMFGAGLEQEVRLLADLYGWDTEPLKGIGYREFKDYFEGNQTLEKTKQRIVSNSMQRLAKRQRSWFGQNKSIHWIKDLRDAVDLTTTFLNNFKIV